MPIAIELTDAGYKLRKRYAEPLLPAERALSFPESAGDFFSTGVTTTDEFASVLDGDPVLLTFDDFTINAGHLVRPSNRCRGLYIHIRGNLTVNGRLSMTARGANVPGKFVGIDHENKIVYFHSSDIFTPEGIPFIGPAGGLITAYPASGSRVNGNAGVNGACGGGGSGARYIGGGGSGNAGRGNAGTSFSGGAGGGGLNRYGNSGNAQDGAINGGKGGNGVASDTDGGRYGRTAGGGAGNPGGTHGKILSSGTGGTAGGTGTGGLMILFVDGDILIGSAGTIESNGIAGGNGSGGTYKVGGGGSGGGAIHIFHKGMINDISKIVTNGGNGGTGNIVGGKGGNGTVNIVQV